MCLCQSGKKYKFCCKNNKIVKYSESEKKEWEGLTNSRLYNNKIVNQNKCIVSTCNEKSIESHAFQRNGILSSISDDNDKIYRLIKSYDNGKYFIKEKYQTTKSATTFYGFCSNHDNEIFECIENEAKVATENERLYAYTYRSISFYYRRVLNEIYILEYEHFKINPYLYSDEIQKESDINFRVYLLNNYYQLKQSEHKLRIALDDIFRNYNVEEKRWSIKSDVLDFSNVVECEVENNGIIFHNSMNRKISDGLTPKEIEPKNVSAEIVTTVVIPNQNDQVRFFISSYRNDYKVNSDFLNQYNCSELSTKINIINNIIGENNQDIYFSSGLLNGIKLQPNYEKYKDTISSKINIEYSRYEINHLSKNPMIEFLVSKPSKTFP